MSRFGGPLKEAPILNRSQRLWYKDFPVGYDPDYVAFMDDFVNVAVDATSMWTVVKDTGASVAIVADTAGGEVRLNSTATTDDDGASIQGNEVFLPVAGRDIWFSARVKVSVGAQCDAFIGLCENFATDPEACLTSSNRIGFQINDGSASLLCKNEKTDTETSTASGVTVANATYYKVEFHVVGVEKIEFYVDRQLVATHTTNIPIVELAPAFFNLSGDATGTHTATADYILCVATR